MLPPFPTLTPPSPLPHNTQGWRRTNEDAHLADAHPSDLEGVFGVFDGHGGAEVARFCQRHLANVLRSHAAWGTDVPQALIDCFHIMDERLASGAHAHELAALRSGDALPVPPRHLVPVGGAAGGGSSSDGTATATAAATATTTTAANTAPLAPPHPAASFDAAADLVAGTTAVIAVIVDGAIHVANAGDSRAVLCCRPGGAGAPRTAVALTTDHKPASPAEAARIRAAGGFVSSIGGVTRVNGNLSLSRAIGDLQYKGDASRGREHQVVTAEPDVRTSPLQPGDEFLLLACDGIWDVVDRQAAVEAVGAALDSGAPPSAAACALLDACLSPDPRATRGAGCDNMTALVVLLPTRER